MILRNAMLNQLILVVAVFLALPVVYASETEVKDSFSLVLGTSPQQNAIKTKVLWEPLTKYIQQQTNYPINFSSSQDISTYEDNLYAGKFDFAFVNPHLFLKVNKYVGYFPVLKESDKMFSSIIIVAKDNKIDSVTELMDKTLVTPQGDFTASALTRLNLLDLGVIVKNSFVKTHHQAYSLVAKGSVDAAGGIQQTFDSLDSELKNRLKILWHSKGVTPDAFIVHPRVNEIVKQRIIDAILSFKDTDEGKLFYKNLNLNPFTSAKSKDWDDIRRLMGY